MTFDVRRISSCLLICVLALVAPSVAFAQSDAEHQQFLFAYRLLQRGDVEEAADEFDEYMGSFPTGEKLGDAQYYRALLHRRAGENEQAARLLTGNAQPTLVPGYAVDLIRGQVLSDLGRYQDALASLERIDVAALEPNVAVSALYLKGLAYRGAENLEAAATALGEAAALDTPMRARALLDLAKVRALMDDSASAIAALDRSLAINDNAVTPEAARFAGDLSYNAGNYAAAIGYYNTVVSRHQASEHFAPAVVGMLWAQFADGQYQALLRTFNSAIETLPVSDRLPAYYLAGSASQEMGNHEQAVQLFSQVAGGDGRLPIQEKVLYKLAVSLFELERYDEMNGAAAALLGRFPQTDLRVDIAFLQATAEAEAGQVDRGAARLTQFIDRGPETAYYQQALLRRAHLYETHNLIEPAAHDYAAYLDSVETPTPTALQASFRLMELLGALGEHEEIIRRATGILRIDDPDLRTPEVEQEALYRLAVANRFEGNLDRALALHAQLVRDHPLNPYRAESMLEQGLIYMAQQDAGRGIPLLLDAVGRENLSPNSRLNALRIVAQHDADNDNPTRALELRMQMQEVAGPEVFTDPERLWVGSRLLAMGDAENALAYLTQVQAPTLRERAMLLTGRARRLTHEYQAATEILREVIAVSERYSFDAMFEIALVYRDGGELEQALGELTALQNPDRGHRIASQALYEAGLIHRRLMDEARRNSNAAAIAEHRDEATEAFEKIWLLYPDREGEDLSKRAYLALADLQFASGDPAAEITTLRRLVEAYSESPYARYAMAVLAIRSNNQEQADTLLRQTMMQAGDDEELRQRADRLLRRER